MIFARSDKPGLKVFYRTCRFSGKLLAAEAASPVVLWEFSVFSF
jgi:hypothetical protein